MLRLLDKVAEAIAVIAFAVSSACIFLNVVNRYLVLGLFRNLAKDFQELRPLYFEIRDLLSDIVVTADEVPGLLLVWVAFLGAYLMMRRGGHIAFDLFVESLPDQIQRGVQRLIATTICLFLAMLCWQSVRMIRLSGATEIETAQIAQGWFMIILPIASVLLIVAVVNAYLTRSEGK